jgi:hypothetical protein
MSIRVAEELGERIRLAQEEAVAAANGAASVVLVPVDGHHRGSLAPGE